MLVFMFRNKIKTVFFSAAILSIAVCFSSCGEDDSSTTTSVVIDEGISDDSDVVSEEITLSGQSTAVNAFSYKSWLNLDITTRASEIVEVTLYSYAAPSKTQSVDRLWFDGELNGDVTFERVESGRRSLDENSNVVIIDSILVAKIPYDGFVFEHQFVYETAIYVDDSGSKKFPYKSFDEESFQLVSDAVMSNLDPLFEGDYIYARRLFTHPAKISFATKEMSTNANSTLELLVSTNGERAVVDSDVEKLEYVDGVNRMWVKHTYSDGLTDEQLYSVSQYSNPISFISGLMTDSTAPPIEVPTVTVNYIGEPVAQSESWMLAIEEYWESDNEDDYVERYGDVWAKRITRQFTLRSSEFVCVYEYAWLGEARYQDYIIQADFEYAELESLDTENEKWEKADSYNFLEGGVVVGVREDWLYSVDVISSFSNGYTTTDEVSVSCYYHIYN